MPNSIRQDILTAIGTDLLHITTANGYANSLASANILKGYVTQNMVNVFPYAFYGLGSEKLTNSSEDLGLLEQEMDAYIGIYFQVNTGQGTMTDEMEKWIRDIKRFLFKDLTISDYFETKSIEGVTKVSLDEILAYPDYEKNIGTLFVMFKIQYVESAITGL